jgi:hypothetical protein
VQESGYFGRTDMKKGILPHSIILINLKSFTVLTPAVISFFDLPAAAFGFYTFVV